MVELPEPDYYTLAEVLKRWDISEAILFRLAREGKIRIGFDPPFPLPLSVFGSWIDDDGDEHDEEIPSELLARETLFTLDHTDRNLVIVERKILLHPSAVPNFEDPAHLYKREFFPRYMELWPNETIPWLKGLPNDWYLMVPLSVQAEFSKELRTTGDLLTALAAETKCRIPVNRIVIPTSEIHRIERQHEAAENAAKDDVLGTKEKETMQAVIAAMTQLIASAKNKYKHGDRPNVDAIATDLEGMIPARTKRGLSDAIGKALKAGLIRT